MSRQTPPSLEKLQVRNFRALQAVTFENITPLTVLVGPNGSGKSTVFDVFAFLAECFELGIRRAWDKRGRFRELRTRGESGPIVFEIKYREHRRPARSPLITYHLAIDEGPRGPYVVREFLQWKRKRYGKPFRFLNFENGSGYVVSGELPDAEDERTPEALQLPEFLAVNTLGQLERNPRVAALRSFITGWYLSYLSVDAPHSPMEVGPHERLSQTGDNLANVIQYLQEQQPGRLETIRRTLMQRIPALENVDAQILADGRLLLQIVDGPFAEPIQARFVSDGTLKMLAYLVVLHDPDPPQLIGIEEPENFLHPRLLLDLAEECRQATSRAQLMVTTHSPFFLDGVLPAELRILYRDAESGCTQVVRAADIPGVNAFIENGARLGDLWMEGHFGVGDPLLSAGGLTHPLLRKK